MATVWRASERDARRTHRSYVTVRSPLKSPAIRAGSQSRAITALFEGPISQSLVRASDSRHPARRLHQIFFENIVTHPIRLQMQHARYNLQAVLYAMTDFLQQHLMAIECGLELALLPLPLDSHAKDIGCALQKGDVVLA